MSRRRRISPARRLAQGRGLGQGANYRPYLEIGDVSSSGFATAVPSEDGSRSVHVLSRKEKGFLYLVRRRTDLLHEPREQVPLYGTEETDEIARSLGFRPLRDPHGQPYVLTTDLVVDFRDGTTEACFVKPMAVLQGSVRECEKVLVEEEYWRRRGYGFRVVTDEEVPDDIIGNLEVLQANRRPPAGFEDPRRRDEGLLDLRDALDGSRRTPLVSACLELDGRTRSPEGSHIALLKHLVHRRSLSMNLYRRLRAEHAYRIEGRWLHPGTDCP